MGQWSCLGAPLGEEPRSSLALWGRWAGWAGAGRGTRLPGCGGTGPPRWARSCSSLGGRVSELGSLVLRHLEEGYLYRGLNKD